MFRLWTSRWILSAIGTALMLLMAGCGGDSDGDGDGEASAAAIAGVETFVIGEAAHVETPVDYDQSPPVGGDHTQVWLNCGFYPGPVLNENAVHALEHGAVWITYKPGTDSETLDAIADRISGESHLFSSEYAEQEAPIVLSAWGAQLKVDSFDDDRVEAFINRYESSKQSPEPGAPCSGGVGYPT